jgi:hypothetical protein
MANTAIYGNYAFFASPEVGWVAVNGSQDGNGLPATGWVMDLSPSGGTPGYQRASIVASRLNAIFGDTNRDLDFILPMADSGGNYLIGCPLVQRNAGATIYYCGTVSNPSDLQCNGCGCGDGTNSLPRLPLVDSPVTTSHRTCTRYMAGPTSVRPPLTRSSSLP